MTESDLLGNKKIIGRTEWVLLKSPTEEKRILARIDTGATKSSIDTKLAAALSLGPIKRTKVVKSAHGTRLRPVIEAVLSIHDKKLSGEFTLADRTPMKYKVLIGNNILSGVFVVDPSKEAR